MDSPDEVTKSAACAKGGSDEPCEDCEFVKIIHDFLKDRPEPTDEELFKPPPPREDCPICMQPPPMEMEISSDKYQYCCGKIMCMACFKGVLDADDEGLCPFCRAPEPISEEKQVELLMIRSKEYDDANAMLYLGTRYKEGSFGLPKDHKKAAELLLQAGKLGSSKAFWELGMLYSKRASHDLDLVVADMVNNKGKRTRERHYDMKQPLKFFTLAAIGGNEVSRHCVGYTEMHTRDNMSRAMKHFAIAARAGCDYSLYEIAKGHKAGHVTKDELEEVSRAHTLAEQAMQSERRDALQVEMQKYLNERRGSENST
ncbi:hypothetical protein ACHAWF_012315 [Thalassiosira exigua]